VFPCRVLGFIALFNMRKHRLQIPESCTSSASILDRLVIADVTRRITGSTAGGTEADTVFSRAIGLVVAPRREVYRLLGRVEKVPPCCS
jgi:hypothetical protein